MVVDKGAGWTSLPPGFYLKTLKKKKKKNHSLIGQYKH